MELKFERGDPTKPKGHALAYFQAGGDPSQLYATYLVVPPINIDLSRYMPSMFAAKLSLADMANISAVPLPPVPEKVDGMGYLTFLAESRDDDLVFAGSIDTGDVEAMLSAAGEAAQAYHRLYESRAERYEPQARPLDANELLYSLMTEKQMLGELAKLAGKLRYAVEGQDAALTREAVGEMERLARHLPEKYRVDEVIEAARLPGERGQTLSKLYIERCFKLSDEEYGALEEIDRKIRELT